MLSCGVVFLVCLGIIYYGMLCVIMVCYVTSGVIIG